MEAGDVFFNFSEGEVKLPRPDARITFIACD